VTKNKGVSALKNTSFYQMIADEYFYISKEILKQLYSWYLQSYQYFCKS